MDNFKNITCRKSTRLNDALYCNLTMRIVIVCYFNGAIMPPKVSEFNGSASVFFCVNMYSCHIFW